MTINNDVCDFHGGYCDPIGCDTRRGMDGHGTMWCGQCESGRIFLFRMNNNAQLREWIAWAKDTNEQSGLSYDNRGTDNLEWDAWLRRDSVIHHGAIELERRAKDSHAYPE